MQQSHFSYLSANGSTTIHATCWAPDGPPVGILQIVHGITEHMGRYLATARYFTSLGYVVAGHDRLGHGASQNAENPTPMYFGPQGSWSYLVQDIKTCTAHIRQQFPGIPCCLLGLSLGSFEVRCLCNDPDYRVDAAVWAGTGHLSSVELAIAGALVKMQQRRYGDAVFTPLVHNLTMESYNKHFAPRRTRADWLFADPAAADDYISDPLVGEGFTVGAFRELLYGTRLCCSADGIKNIPRDLPILLASGRDDPVGNFGKGVAAVRGMLQKAGHTDVEMLLFDGMRHSFFAGQGSQEALSQIAAWMDKRLGIDR